MSDEEYLEAKLYYQQKNMLCADSATTNSGELAATAWVSASGR